MNAQVVDIVYGVQATKYTSAAATVIYIYDILLSFETEVRGLVHYLVLPWNWPMFTRDTDPPLLEQVHV
jgi:hypothetical protein